MRYGAAETLRGILPPCDNGGLPPPCDNGGLRKSRLNDAEAEAAETQVWLEVAVKCGYLDAETGRDLYARYDQIIGKIVQMITHPQHWTTAA